jgi:5-methylthioadenosine/S-adenosylhomocysteine deaminase
MSVAVEGARHDGAVLGLRADDGMIAELGPGVEAGRLASGRCSPLLGPAGRLARGEPADFLLLADAPELALGDFTSALAYAASGAVVDTTVVAGRVLMRGGRVEGSDEVLARARDRARRLGLA